ncbi:MAG: hypothetical protein LBC73_05685 [Oscillospiraceae bacterium]|jgi:hypothetical protein|nr:hypothetical protein [Oscillospiraceae bacterium]
MYFLYVSQKSDKLLTNAENDFLLSISKDVPIQSSDTKTISKISEKCIIIKITQDSIDRNKGCIYDTTRQHWKISIHRARTADYVLSVQDGTVIEVFSCEKWETFNDGNGRIIFEGRPADDNIRNKYIGKMIPEEYRKKGCANPCQYVNC